MVRSALTFTSKPQPSGNSERAASPTYLYCPTGISKAKPFLRSVILKAQRQRRAHIAARVSDRLSNTME